MKSNRILLKAAEFHRISWNQQDLTQFHKIQHNFTKTNRIYWNWEISKDFMRSNRILLKATEFYRISLNSLQISLQISLWMSFMDLTAWMSLHEFHCRFHYGFHCKFHANSTIFHCQFHDKFHYIYQDFTEINKISWNPQHLTEFHWNQQDFIMDFTDGFHSCEICNEIHNEISKWNLQWNP